MHLGGAVVVAVAAAAQGIYGYEYIYKCHAAQALTHKIGPNAERYDIDMPKR